MVSGVGFKNTADEEQKGAPRKRLVSRGLIGGFIILLIILASWGGLKMWESSIRAEVVALDEQIRQTNLETRTALESSDVSDFAVRAGIMEEELYRGHSTNDVLDEIERIMILEKDEAGTPGDRIVLKSFEHSSGAIEKRTISDVDVITTGMGNITISADADSFDVMAQQIEEFKKSEYFSNVTVGTTDRDDFGRIIFTLTMDVKGFDSSPYEMYTQNGDAQQITEPVVTEDASADVEEAGAELIQQDENISDQATGDEAPSVTDTNELQEETVDVNAEN